MDKPYLLTFETYDDWDMVPMQAAYTIIAMPETGKVSDLPAEVIPQITAIAFRGHSALGAEIIDALPNLGLIANYGVGYDTIDVAHATANGIRVSNTPDVLTEDVADLVTRHALVAHARSIDDEEHRAPDRVESVHAVGGGDIEAVDEARLGNVERLPDLLEEQAGVAR